MSELRPILRFDLDIAPYQINGESFLVLRDVLGLSTQPAFVPHFLGGVLMLLDGSHTVGEIIAAGARQGLEEELIRKFLGELEELVLLESDRYHSLKREMVESYRRQRVREAALAGAVYPENSEELSRLVRSLLRPPKGGNPLRAVISPHIDYPRGGSVYGSIYSELSAASAPDTLFLIGTCHKASKDLYILSDKRFQIPGCEFEPDAQLIERFFPEYLQEEYLHRDEHSLELQLPFLAEVYKSETRPRIVPIIVGSFFDFVESGVQPDRNPHVAGFIDALAAAIRFSGENGKRVQIIAGVDFAHLGRFFGDNAPPDRSSVQLRDFELIDSLRELNPERLFRHIHSDRDARRICGFPTLYTVMSAMQRLPERYEFELVDYAQAYDEVADCLVTFAGAGWRVG